MVAGPWSHVEPPRQLPTWVNCSGFQGLLAYANLDEPIPNRSSTLVVNGQQAGRDVDLVARAIAMPDSAVPAYAVIVDLLVNEPVRGRASLGNGRRADDRPDDERERAGAPGARRGQRT